MTHFRCKKPFVNPDENSHLKFFRSFSALNFHEELEAQLALNSVSELFLNHFYQITVTDLSQLGQCIVRSLWKYVIVLALQDFRRQILYETTLRWPQDPHPPPFKISARSEVLQFSSDSNRACVGHFPPSRVSLVGVRKRQTV